MAVVWRKVYEDGGIVEIMDDAYRDITPEEHARRVRALGRTVSELLGVECEVVFANKHSCAFRPIKEEYPVL